VTDAARLASADRAFTIAPAGFGKTELITQAVSLSLGRSLVLTHTHSGVNALRNRFRRRGIPQSQYVVETIAGFCLKYASAYPQLSALTVALPSGTQWPMVYDAASQVLSRSVMRKVLTHSFAGVYVDEYQDCNLRQHKVVLRLAEILPCRLLGDPLQAIFEFDGPLITWETDVAPHFERLPDLNTPFRWEATNPKLGSWLLNVRERLIVGEPIRLEEGPIRWMPFTHANQRTACLHAAQARSARVVAIRKRAPACHKLASMLSGLYSSMEELDCKSLMAAAGEIDAGSGGHEVAVALIDFAAACFTRVKTHLQSLREQYAAGQTPRTTRLSRNRAIAEVLNRVAVDPSPDAMIDGMRSIEAYPDVVLYRRELWSEMKTALLTFRNGTHGDLASTAWYVRDRARRFGRRPEHRVISRTLLVKGLEFDHSVVLNADELTPKEMYVAMTRGSRALTVLSGEPMIHRPPVGTMR
jgi:hypothetical protein